MAGSLLLMTGAHAQTATPASEPGVEIYLPDAFAEFLPQNANDLVRRLPGFQIDRSKLDETVLDLARSEGAEVLRPARVRAVETSWPVS